MVDKNVRGKDDIAAAKIEKQKKQKKKDGFWGNVRVILEALAIALVIRTLLFQPFYIPSGSMKPSLLVGDYIVINKFSYGYSKYSCPFALCPISGRLFGQEPKQGDVVVFANPGDGPNHNVPYVKRLIGMPGDRIQMKNSALYINGEAVEVQPIADFAEPLSDYKVERVCAHQDSDYCYISQAEEILPNDVTHPILNFGDDFPLDNTGEWIVPEGHYFMMGDNRDNSADSRADVGFVPYENFIGKAKLIVFSSSGSSLFKFWKWRSDRYFKRVE